MRLPWTGFRLWICRACSTSARVRRTQPGWRCWKRHTSSARPYHSPALGSLGACGTSLTSLLLTRPPRLWSLPPSSPWSQAASRYGQNSLALAHASCASAEFLSPLLAFRPLEASSGQEPVRPFPISTAVQFGDVSNRPKSQYPPPCSSRCGTHDTARFHCF